MTISSTNSNISLSPKMELHPVQGMSAKQRAIAEKIVSSLPGNHQRGHSQAGNIKRIASDIKQVSQTFNKKLQFIVDHQSNEVIVKVIDKSTDKVIKVLPPEELQRLHRKLKETIGFLFNEQV